MTLRWLLDTDICIFVLKNRTPELRDRFVAATGRLAVSTVTLAELVYGAEKSAKVAHNMRLVDELTARLEVLDFDAAAASHYGCIRAELEREGRRIGTHDMMIAGHARSRGLAVVTNNRREFDRVAGLLVENWV